MKKYLKFLTIALLIVLGFSAYAGNDDPVPLSPVTQNAPTDQTTYNPLAPIGNLTSIKTNNIGEYLNLMFKLGIGICAALAVVMIIISSIQYMGNESVFGKTEAKGKIFSAILGLLIALGAYALLNTINPDLTGATGVHIDQVSVDIEHDTVPITSDTGTAVPTGATGLCSQGIVTVSTSGGTFHACKNIADGLGKMINAAWAAGYKIAGGGFRSIQTQIELRKKNCGGSDTYTVYEKPSTQCNPPTGRPGKSNHQSGLAFDLTCDGSTITTQSNRCFGWLSKNAATYGLKNYAAEPWHWSVDGR